MLVLSAESTARRSSVARTMAETLLDIRCGECSRRFLVHEADVDSQVLTCPHCGMDVDVDDEEEDEADEEDNDRAV